MFITKPTSFVAFFLNSIYGDVLKWKLKAENELRKSQIDYTILRLE